jgi:hypothetical protein
MNTATFLEVKRKNRVELAKSRLDVHRSKGQQSDLSIFEAARLMDLLVFNQDEIRDREMFFKFSLN